MSPRPKQARMKRALDLALTVPGLVVAAPLMAGTAMALRLSVGSPVVFRHQRPGQGAKPFVLLKFRTMSDERDEEGRLLPDEQRLTKVGALVRRLSLDELPQLLNVLKGDMSLVGPRPLLMEYLERYSPEQARRHEVKPGITGWAQVNGRNALSWEEKLALDVYYVEHASLGLDLRILAKTALKVFRREGVSAAGHATMPVFMGAASPGEAP
jgi:sugar transferase EpsL